MFKIFITLILSYSYIYFYTNFTKVSIYDNEIRGIEITHGNITYTRNNVCQMTSYLPDYKDFTTKSTSELWELYRNYYNITDLNCDFYCIDYIDSTEDIESNKIHYCDNNRSIFKSVGKSSTYFFKYICPVTESSVLMQSNTNEYITNESVTNESVANESNNTLNILSNNNIYVGNYITCNKTTNINGDFEIYLYVFLFSIIVFSLASICGCFNYSLYDLTLIIYKTSIDNDGFDLSIFYITSVLNIAALWDTHLKVYYNDVGILIVLLFILLMFNICSILYVIIFKRDFDYIGLKFSNLCLVIFIQYLFNYNLPQMGNYNVILYFNGVVNISIYQKIICYVMHVNKNHLYFQIE